MQYEFDTVYGYDEYIDTITERAEHIADISVFTSADNTQSDFNQKNLEKSVHDYQNVRGVQPEYHPQKGLRTSTNYRLTDFIILFLLIFMGAALVREELDTGMIYLLRSTPKGKLVVVFHKMGVLLLSTLIITILFYGSNLLTCSIRYGIGSPWQPIQSYAFLVQSILPFSVIEYLFAFLITKWLGLFVLSLWVVFACLLIQKPTASFAVALLFPVVSEAMRVGIAPTSQYNLLRYANIASLLQTNEILGTYRNLNIAGRPILLSSIELFAGCLYTLLLLILIGVRYTNFNIKPKRMSHFRLSTIYHRKNSRKPPTRTSHEIYKILIMNGASLVLLTFCVIQGFIAYSRPTMISPEELYLRNYLHKVEGPMNLEKYEWAKEESQRFKPIIELDNAVAAGHITDEQYQNQLARQYDLRLQYGIFQELLYQMNDKGQNPEQGRHFVYEPGYRVLLGFEGSDIALECLLTCFVIILVCSPVFAIENQIGMDRILQTTPLGVKCTINTKVAICTVVAVLCSALSFAPKLYWVVRDYWFSVPLSPLRSLSFYEGAPRGFPIILFLIIVLLMRILGCLAIQFTVLACSKKLGSTASTLLLSALVFCLPLLLAQFGLENAKYFGVYPLFDFPVLVSNQTTTGFSVLAWGMLFLLFPFFVIAYNSIYRVQDKD